MSDNCHVRLTVIQALEHHFGPIDIDHFTMVANAICKSLFCGTRLQSTRHLCIIKLERMFKLCAPAIEFGGQNGVFLAGVLPGCAGFVPSTKMACIAMVHNIG